MLSTLTEKWQSDKALIESELKMMGATSDEIEIILKKIRTPVEPEKSIKTRISGTLFKFRKQQELKQKDRE